ncbi:ribosomal protein S12 methylthiotransferase accessory factor [Streptoalloteichus tenebrarius]|uniref:Ribosomal protein S12 methylthiotransferase accessory factor n=1 Tax=Streptoalloteichus tenebrarius (strain ATCC 17920 / DSM 40477 / JCM 4838 / CBS 697.72 / NBRC 16177 / NCIMB 11028 / NRRL B-12390 / A12253. 1 / ISP 5477) TaxID=1933 RepID=A0ABT1HPG5_STRSD|nr:TOMM precursor leader peptide-binding protein [Streptoalloteichus tenebrarius]MCP2257402.1 ribosomal protein S12 methylthiotransferase accessory factor [Streptoalloteichus tenebrarius]BFE98348.1 hypothetical protein GCM10020241_00240 [Streptoalloteichus tenebrarius]
MPRADVRITRAGAYVYVCSGDGTFRLRLAEQEPETEPPSGWQALPETAQQDLARRGLLVNSANALHQHPSYQDVPPTPTAVVVTPDGPVGDLVRSAVRKAGLGVADDHESPAGVIALSLSTPDDEMRRWADVAARHQVPVVAYLSTVTRLYLAVLRPPTTACPLCVALRMRANLPAQDIAHLPLDSLVGGCSDDRWPTTTAAASLVAHHVILALRETPPGEAGGPGELWELDLDSLTRTVHPLLHLPLCPGCAGRVATPGEDLFAEEPEPATEECWRRMSRGVDPLTGIVGEVRLIRLPRGWDGGAGGSCWLGVTVGGTATRRFSPLAASTKGAAAKHDPTLARVCALGEVLERYPAGVYDPARLVRATLAELGPAAVDPRTLPLGSEREYEACAGELSPYDPDEPLDWVPAVSLRTREQRYLPACAVYVPYRPPRREERLMHPISTGLAAGSTARQALLGGLLEAVERDAFMIFWLNRLTLPTLDLDSLPPGRARAAVDAILARGVDLLAKDITTDLGIPSVLLSARHRTPDHPFLAVQSSRAALDFETALLGAAAELELSLSQVPVAIDKMGILDDPLQAKDIMDCATFYCRADRHQHLDFLREGPVRPVPDTVLRHGRDDVERVVNQLALHGYEAIATDITSVDVAECGVRSVRSVVPGLQPISFTLRFRRLGGPRLYQAPVAMGARNTPLTEDELNPHPVPLA